MQDLFQLCQQSFKCFYYFLYSVQWHLHLHLLMYWLFSQQSEVKMRTFSFRWPYLYLYNLNFWWLIHTLEYKFITYVIKSSIIKLHYYNKHYYILWKSLKFSSHIQSLGLGYTASLLVFPQKHFRSAKSFTQKARRLSDYGWIYVWQGFSHIQILLIIWFYWKIWRQSTQRKCSSINGPLSVNNEFTG